MLYNKTQYFTSSIIVLLSIILSQSKEFPPKIVLGTALVWYSNEKNMTGAKELS